MPDEAEVTTTEQGQPDEVEEYKLKLADESRRREAAERQFQYFKTQAEQSAAQLRHYQQQSQQSTTYQPDYENQPTQPPQKSPRDVIRDIRDAMTAYKVNNPDWVEYDKDMRELIFDQSRNYGVIAYDNTGQPDWDTTVVNARSAVELSKWRQTKQKAADITGKAEANKAALRRAATVTGDSGASPPQTIDPGDPRNPDGSPMTSDQMLEAGLVDFDPNDPIKPSGYKRRPR